VFDVEVMYNLSQFPAIATAVSSDNWYSWCSSGLFTGKVPDELISFGNLNEKKVIIGHNVSYDRSRINEEYYLERSNFAFIDTLSLHSCVGGLSSQQRPGYMAYKSTKHSKTAPIEDGIYEKPLDWLESGTTNR
jgi:DNA polymerase gamma 1